MHIFALTVGYSFLLGGLTAVTYTFYTNFFRDEEDLINKYYLQIMFFGVLSITIGLIILNVNGENVMIKFWPNR